MYLTHHTGYKIGHCACSIGLQVKFPWRQCCTSDDMESIEYYIHNKCGWTAILYRISLTNTSLRMCCLLEQRNIDTRAKGRDEFKRRNLWLGWLLHCTLIVFWKETNMVFLTKNQRDALISKIYFSDRFSVHHQEYSTVNRTIGVCHTGFVYCLLAGSGWILIPLASRN